MKTFDCRLGGEIPEIEIEAADADQAKRLYLEAVLRAITSDLIVAVEVEIVQ